MKKIIILLLMGLPLFMVGCEKTIEPTEVPSVEETKTPTPVEVWRSVSFESNGGTEVLDSRILDGNKVSKPTDPTKEGYTFDGWYKEKELTNLWDFDKNVVNANITLYAKWQELYDITFVNNGYGDNVDEIVDVLVLPELPVLTDENYVFAGWYFDEELTKDAVIGAELSGDVTLYAKWEKKTYDFSKYDEDTKSLLNAGGVLNDKITDFNQYVGTEYYRVVTTPEELASALFDAKYKYTNNWNEDTGTVEQVLEKEGTVRVIEIANDLNLGFNVISANAKANGIIVDFKTNGATSEMVKTNGISQIKVENISNLLIYSKNGAKLTHAGFKLTSCHNVVFRNLKMDEIWEWEDSSDKTPSKIGDYDKFGWAYFKISHCGQIWIDHMDFGKSYDGQIDYANPVSNSKSTKIRLAYGSDGTNGLHISYCNFNAGSDDKDGYLYKMMENMENKYNAGDVDFLYYNALRDAGLTFEQILYGIAIPQKKGFLCGDNADSKDDFYYNANMLVSFNSCRFMNFCDRIPKLRGGQCYFYNSIIDSSKYYEYRDTVKTVGSKAVTKVNSSWKCAGVSQGALISYGGYLHFENTIIKGVKELIKNNDSKSNPFIKNQGFFSFINCSYQLDPTSTYYEGSTTDENIPTPFVKNASNLKTAETIWPNTNGVPLAVEKMIPLKDLENHLNHKEYGAGTKQDVSSWLVCNLD